MSEHYPNDDPDRKTTLDASQQLADIEAKKRKRLVQETPVAGTVQGFKEDVEPAYEPKREELNELESNADQLSKAKMEQEPLGYPLDELKELKEKLPKKLGDKAVPSPANTQ